MPRFGSNWSVLVVALIWIFWTLLVFVVGWAMSYQLGRQHRESKPHHIETALDILQQRYAKGEITREQFEQMKRDIGH